MDVEAAELRQIQYRLRQEQTIGGHHHDFGVDCGQTRLSFGGFQVVWLENLDAMRDGHLFDG